MEAPQMSVMLQQMQLPSAQELAGSAGDLDPRLLECVDLAVAATMAALNHPHGPGDGCRLVTIANYFISRGHQPTPQCDASLVIEGWAGVPLGSAQFNFVCEVMFPHQSDAEGSFVPYQIKLRPKTSEDQPQYAVVGNCTVKWKTVQGVRVPDITIQT